MLSFNLLSLYSLSLFPLFSLFVFLLRIFLLCFFLFHVFLPCLFFLLVFLLCLFFLLVFLLCLFLLPEITHFYHPYFPSYFFTVISYLLRTLPFRPFPSDSISYPPITLLSLHVLSDSLSFDSPHHPPPPHPDRIYKTSLPEFLLTRIRGAC